MTAKEIDKTLNKLHYTIDYQRHVLGNDEKIRVRIGRALLAWINCYTSGLIWNYSNAIEEKTIWGFPLEVDNVNPMCCEVLIVESVPIYRESEQR